MDGSFNLKSQIRIKTKLTDEEFFEYCNLLLLEDEQISDAPAISSDEEGQIR